MKRKDVIEAVDKVLTSPTNELSSANRKALLELKEKANKAKMLSELLEATVKLMNIICGLFSD